MSKNLVVLLCCLASCHGFTSRHPPVSSLLPLFSTAPTTTSTGTTEDESTVVSITSPTGQTITLIGTAHLSEKSNDQVQRLIETLQPNAVMVETDESRLERIGIPTLGDIKVTNVVTSEDIELPVSALSSKPETPWFLNPLGMAKDVFVQAFTKVARALLTNMYNDMGDRMNAKGGGEFLRAIQCAENCTACDTVILGDRNSLITISRAAELALESGDPMGVLGRLQQVNGEEMEKLETKIKAELKEKHGDDLDDSEVTVAIMEGLKADTEFRTRLFSKLEQEVPEFTQAFLKERDYLMSESIRRELERPEVKSVVGVVGLAHVPGMEKHFEAVFSNQPAPLAHDLAAVIDN